MSAFELWLLAVGLAMDCLTMSIASGLILKKIYWRTILITSFCFGLFQGLMPFIGWLGTMRFSSLIEQCDHWIAFALLVFLGGKMIYESFKLEEEKSFNPNSFKVILLLSVATSIDALAVGISFSCTGYHTLEDISYPIWVIGVVSSFFSFIGFMIGIFAGKRFTFPVERVGGMILLFIGCKILYTHLLG